MGVVLIGEITKHPLRITKIELQKTKINPDRFLKVCRGDFSKGV